MMTSELQASMLRGSMPLPAAATWTRMPYRDTPRFDAPSALSNWARLHAGQALPPPGSQALLEGWACYHNGDFAQAAEIGQAHGSEGLALTWQATAIYANYLEPREAVRLALFRQVYERAQAQAERQPEDVEALFWQAYALGRYSQCVSVARALAQGLGGKVKGALERVIALRPDHADAFVALGAFHAEVIDKVGPLVARMTYGVQAELAIELFEQGLSLHPDSARALMEYARGLLMIFGDARMAEATQLYRRASMLEPADARERLDVELARAGLDD